jgi:hypothetical protein
MRLQNENDEARAEMLLHDGRFQKIRGEKPRAISSFNLFQTPVHIAELMAAMLPDHPAPRVLEPSAGLGRLFDAAYNRYGSAARYHLVEQSPECMAELYNRNLPVQLHQCDFLNLRVSGDFHAIIMNPPFKQGTDIKHIIHAREMLAPGGVLVALCYNGVRQNEQLRPIADSWEILPDNSFRESGTGASVAILTMHKLGTP